MRTKLTTILGALVALFGILSQPDILALIPTKYSAVVTGFGTVLAVLGRSLLAPTNSPPANEVK